MKFYYLVGFMLLGFFGAALADNQNCQALLNQPSQLWISKNSQNTLAIIEAANQYGHCVDKNTQQIYQQMLKTGNYPLMGANGDYRDFTTALKNFTRLALKITATGGSWDNTQAAYVNLYQKQFKLLFYADYINTDNTPDVLLNRLKNTPRPDLKKSKRYFEKMMGNIPLEKRSLLLQAFDQLIKSSSFAEQSSIHQEYIYDYAIFILQSPADKPYALPPF